MDESLALHHEFGIDATNNWGGGAPLLITSNTGNDIPVRSTAMLINDPRKGLDEGLCNECTEVLLFIHVPVKRGRACVVVACRYMCMFWADKVFHHCGKHSVHDHADANVCVSLSQVEVDTSLEEIARTGKLHVKSISDMFGPPSQDGGGNQILFPIAIGKDGEYISDLKVFQFPSIAFKISGMLSLSDFSDHVAFATLLSYFHILDEICEKWTSQVIGVDREKNDILVSKDFLKRVPKSSRKKVIPEGTDVIQHANCYFQVMSSSICPWHPSFCLQFVLGWSTG